MADKPNILVIWGDDIGISNLSCYSDGVMGYRTPNIDRIADEGMRFTDSYGEQSCTAGRASFLTGQSVFRTGLSKVGMPGSEVGLQAEDPTIAELLKPFGYATGQFGKNHLGDLNKFLPTVHGFDEFFGNLYHLNAEEEPELPDYPPAEDFPHFRERFGPRGVMHSWATDEDDATEEPRWGKVGKQRIEDTGPLTKKRMETIDDEVLEHTVDFIERQHAAETPFFVWCNTTHMHFRTHPKPESVGQAGRWQSPYHDTMIDHDKAVGSLLDKLDELGIADDTIVIYSTDNGPHMNSWPDGGMTPFRSEKNSNWEGAFRIPELVRWPGKIPAGTVSNEIVQHHDWLPTFLAAAGRAGRRREAEEGPRSRRQDVQGPHRRLQPLAVPDRRGRQEPQAGVRVLLRRRRRARAALRQLEGRLHGAAGAGDPTDLGGAVRRAACSEAVQPPHRPVRARGHHLEHLLGLGARQRVPGAGRGSSDLGVPFHVRRLPAATEGGELHDRPGARETRGRAHVRSLRRQRSSHRERVIGGGTLRRRMTKAR